MGRTGGAGVRAEPMEEPSPAQSPTKDASDAPAEAEGLPCTLPVSGPGADEKGAPLRIAVGSGNAVKVAAARAAFERSFPGRALDLQPVKAESGVSDQPFGDKETKLGARNRAVHAAELFQEKFGAPPDFSVGLEGGVGEEEALQLPGEEEEGARALESFAWMAVRSARGTFGFARAASFALPDAVGQLVRSGVELGVADDKVFGRSGSKTQEGAVGLLTHGLIDRASYYEHPLLLALIPFRNPDLF